MSELDDRIAAEMRAIKGPSEMVRLVPEGRAERQVAAVEKAMLMMRVREDFLRASHRMDEAKIAEACVFDIRRALETE